LIRDRDSKHARELRKISDILDRLPLAGDLVYYDLISGGPDVSAGRPCLSGDQVLRLLILNKMNGFSYEELAFHLADSRVLWCGALHMVRSGVVQVVRLGLSGLDELADLGALHDGMMPGRRLANQE
jgi:hypothetical protein